MFWKSRAQDVETEGAFHVRIAVGTVIRVSNKCYVNVNRESDRPVEQWGKSGL